MAITEAAVTEALKTVIDPNTDRNLVDSRSARNIRVTDNDVAVDVELGYPALSQIGLILFMFIIGMASKLLIDAVAVINSFFPSLFFPVTLNFTSPSFIKP